MRNSRTRATMTGDVWWKNAVVYCLDVETFFDGNGDGIGDFAGLSERLDHLVYLGVDVVWLMPFYPTANVDDGYDITDYYSVDPRLGTLGDFTEFVRTAGEKGLRVIADLVVNHTSSAHPWFVEARSSRDSPRRDWYVWRDEPGPEKPGDVVFPDRENSIWTRDRKSGQYYLHRFYRSQPDLNVANPAVRDEIARIMGFWMALGLSGFRVDAVPFLLETQSADGAPGVSSDLPDPHDYLRDLRAFLNRRDGPAVMLGEVNLPYQDARAFFGDEDGDELTMLFDFPLMQAMYLALARGDAGPMRTALTSRPHTPDDSQWAVFVRNHDELTLDKLSRAERQEVFDAFGPDESMQVYGRGLRRRLPSMLDGDRDRIRLVYSLALSLPGTPTLFYGEEIGMGEQLSLDGRMAVRTPMQWASGPAGGFSGADSVDALCRPFPDAPFAPDQVNVTDQRHDPDSLLRWMRERLRIYRESPELGWGAVTVLDQPHGAVFAHRADWRGGTLVLVHNLGPDPVDVPLSLLDRSGHRLVDLVDVDRSETVGGDGAVTVPLTRYGGRWFRVVGPDELVLV